MHMVSLAFVSLWLYYHSQCMYEVHSPILFSVTSLALGQSYDCPSASEVTLDNMNKINQNQTTKKHKTAQTVCIPLLWRHDGHDGVSNHQSHDCLFNRLFRRWSKKTPKLHVTAFVRGPVNSPHKWPVTRKCFHLMTSSCIMGCCMWIGRGDTDTNWTHYLVQGTDNPIITCYTFDIQHRVQ